MVWTVVETKKGSSEQPKKQTFLSFQAALAAAKSAAEESGFTKEETDELVGTCLSLFEVDNGQVNEAFTSEVSGANVALSCS